MVTSNTTANVRKMCKTVKIKLIPMGTRKGTAKQERERVIQYLKDSEKAQQIALNHIIGQLTAEYYACGSNLNSPEFKERRKEILNYWNPVFHDVVYLPPSSELKSAITWKLNKEFSSIIKNGLAKGERTVTNYSLHCPIPTAKNRINFEHNCSSDIEFLEKMYTKEVDVQMRWINRFRFRVDLGNLSKSKKLRKTFAQLFLGNIEKCDSSIQLCKNKEIFLNLCIMVSETLVPLNEETVVGVDLNLNHPAVCALNNDKTKMLFVGNIAFRGTRETLKAARLSKQSSLMTANGSHGRGKKLAALKSIKRRERNFAKTYNHTVARRVVNFALENNAKYINIENLQGATTQIQKDSSMEFVSSNWSYYELQQYIKYKAEAVGIEVREVNSYNTSKMCSYCGSENDEQLVSFHEFVCSNPNCESHTLFPKAMDADFNAARNTALSTEWSSGKKKFADSKKQHEDAKSEKGKSEEEKETKEESNTAAKKAKFTNPYDFEALKANGILTARTANALTTAGYKNVSDLHGKSVKDIKKIRGFGDSAINQLFKYLNSLDFVSVPANPSEKLSVTDAPRG